MSSPPRHYWLVAVRCGSRTHFRIVQGALEAFSKARRAIHAMRPDLKHDLLHGIPMGVDDPVARAIGLPKGVEAVLADLGPDKPKGVDAYRLGRALLDGPLS